MARMDKFNRGAVGHMFEHYDRTKVGENCVVRPELTKTNYNLAPADKGQLERLRDVIGNKAEGVKGWAKCQNRQDVNVVCTWVVTMPKDLPADKRKGFFQEAYNFLAERYGVENGKNIISAYVHLDEKTPHMHFCFVPIVVDKKKGTYKVSAKERFPLGELKTFHKELQEHLERKLRCVVNVLTGTTEKKGKSIKELKQETEEKIRACKEKALASEEELRTVERQCVRKAAFEPSFAQKLAGMEAHGERAEIPWKFYLRMRATILKGIEAMQELGELQEQGALIESLKKRVKGLDDALIAQVTKAHNAEKELESLKEQMSAELSAAYEKGRREGAGEFEKEHRLELQHGNLISVVLKHKDIVARLNELLEEARERDRQKAKTLEDLPQGKPKKQKKNEEKGKYMGM